MIVDPALAGRIAAGVVAAGIGTAVSHGLVKDAFVYGYELPPSELVAETDTVIIERTRPSYHTLVHIGSLAIGLGMAGAAGVLYPRATTPLLLAGVYGLAGLGLGVVPGTTGAASLFDGTTIRKMTPLELTHAEPFVPVLPEEDEPAAAASTTATAAGASPNAIPSTP